MKKLALSSLVLAAPMLIAVGCSTSSKTDSAANQISQERAMDAKVATKMDAPFMAEVEFGTGKTTLDEANRKRVLAAIDEARASGAEIDDVKVITWADAEYPTQGKGKLSAEQKRLVDRRNTYIKDLIKESARNVDVDTYNMAERPNALERMLNTTDAKLKKSFESAGLASGDAAAGTSKASKSVVMIVTE